MNSIHAIRNSTKRKSGMMSHKQNKLENPERLAELSPETTLKRIGLGKSDVLCDIGAGSGIFTIPAAKMTNNLVMALELSDELLDIIKEKAKNQNLDNISVIKVTEDRYNIDAETVDFAILVTVFHEIENKDTLLSEIKRVLKKSGKLAIIEFHKRQTPMGPPVSHRIGKEDVAAICGGHGLNVSDEFDLGDNFYCICTCQQVN